MKVRIGKDRGSGATLMTVSSARGEAPDVSHAQMFASGGASLLAYRCDMTDKDVTYTYNVTGCTSLHDVMRQPMTDAVFANALVAAYTVMHLCETSGLALETVLWDPKQVFVAPNGAVYLAMAPMLGLGTTKHMPVALIGLMGEERRVKPATARCEWLQQSVRAFTQQLPVFNGVQFAAFLESIGLLSSAVPDATVAGETVGGETIGGATISGATIASTQMDATVAGSTIMSVNPASANPAGPAGSSQSAVQPVQGAAAQSGLGGMKPGPGGEATNGTTVASGTGASAVQSQSVSGANVQDRGAQLGGKEYDGAQHGDAFGQTVNDGRRYIAPSPFQQETGGHPVSPLQRLRGTGPEPIRSEPLAAQSSDTSSSDDEEDGTVLSSLGPAAPRRTTAQPQPDAVTDALHRSAQTNQPAEMAETAEKNRTIEPVETMQTHFASQPEPQPSAKAPVEPEIQPTETPEAESGPADAAEPQACGAEPKKEPDHTVETPATVEPMSASEPPATRSAIVPEPAAAADSVAYAEIPSMVDPKTALRDATQPVPPIEAQAAPAPVTQAQPTPAVKSAAQSTAAQSTVVTNSRPAGPTIRSAAQIPVQPIAQPVARPVVQPFTSLPVHGAMTEPATQADDGEGETRIFGVAAQTGFTVTRLRDGRRLNATGAIAHKATIGRSKTADLHMGGNTNVSRVHATIEMLPDGRFCITDNNSANGTSVRGREVAPGGTEFLNSGEDFELADDTFIIELL